MVEDHAAFVKLVTELRKLGATHVRAGDLEVTLSPPLATAPPRPTETAEERRKREAEEFERDLNWSTRA